MSWLKSQSPNSLCKPQPGVLTEYELSHHVLVVLAVRNKMLTKFFLRIFKIRYLLLKRNSFYFFYGHSSQFIFSSKILFSGFMKMERNEKFNSTLECYTC